MWAWNSPYSGGWELDWERVDAGPTKAEVLKELLADPPAAAYVPCARGPWRPQDGTLRTELGYQSATGRKASASEVRAYSHEYR
ncbi:hypothetical protein ACIA8I_41640 [Streptomyces rishiriensis]|uniref:hypothetical protein n=1 Tax=Streptomyces rishiriensis TaxID=68264 RepID=UPI0037ACB64E